MNAYLDPGSSSMLLSALVGGIAGIAVVFKTMGHRIWSFLAFWKKDEKDHGSEVADDATEDEPTKADAAS
ncbi:MAG TPA: hypothetical protein VD926_00905 [Acidimicrobiales bacterium]|nr:hypothetical protein [Acidimicrobiales bacterium]